MIRTIERIRTNKIKCKKCGDIIESVNVHDFKWCSCGAVAVDGGREYLRRLGNKKDFEELSHFIKLVKIITDGFDVVENAIYKNNYSFDDSLCPQCNSNNITFEKCDKTILGDDITSVVCHDCKKIFKFMNIKYK